MFTGGAIEGLPLYAVDLINDLDKLFPEKCPSVTMSDREIWMAAGQRSVVNHLLLRKAKAEETEYAEGGTT